MYLSRVRVATEGLDRRALLNLLSGNAYTNHQLLWRLFEDHAERQFLFRQEIETEQVGAEQDPRGLPLFYVLSQSMPTNVPGLLLAETKPFAPELQGGEQLAFRLRANPTIDRKESGKKNATRHDVLMDAKTQCRRENITDPEEIHARMNDAALQWLHRKSQMAGFTLEGTPQVTGYRQQSIHRKGRDIRFSSIDYEGLLSVASPESFTSSLSQGLGRSKAFGCGLMMIRRP